jgi:hypothetical protein
VRPQPALQDDRMVESRVLEQPPDGERCVTRKP